MIEHKNKSPQMKNEKKKTETTFDASTKAKQEIFAWKCKSVRRIAQVWMNSVDWNFNNGSNSNGKRRINTFSCNAKFRFPK